MDTIVFVDNDSKWTANYKRMLTPYEGEMNCVYFQHPEEAMEYMSKHPTQVLISELDMPVMSGRELFEMIDMFSPMTVKIGITQVRDVTDTLNMLNQTKIYKLILKPFFVAEDLVVPIRAALEHYKENVKEREVIQKAEEKLQILNQETEELLKKMKKKKRGHDRILNAMLGLAEQNLSFPVADFAPKKKVIIKRYCEELLQEFFQYYMYEKKNLIFYINYLKNKFHHPGQSHSFIIQSRTDGEIPVTVMNRIAYVMFLTGFLCEQCLEEYHVENTLEEEDKEYVLRIRYDWDKDRHKNTGSQEEKLLQRMVKELECALSDRMTVEEGYKYVIKLYFQREEEQL